MLRPQLHDVKKGVMRSGNKVGERLEKKCCKQINIKNVLHLHNISFGKLIEGVATGLLKLLGVSMQTSC